MRHRAGGGAVLVSDEEVTGEGGAGGVRAGVLSQLCVRGDYFWRRGAGRDWKKRATTSKE